jgi:putative FmdB family regulatory protein
MPTYLYECKKCGEIKVYQKMSEDSLVLCPQCGEQVTKVITGTSNILFRGPGFYYTDYKRNYKDVKDPSVSRDEKITRRKEAIKTIKKHIK